MSIYKTTFFSGNATEVLFHVTVMSLDTIDESSMVSFYLITTIFDFEPPQREKSIKNCLRIVPLNCTRGL